MDNKSNSLHSNSGTKKYVNQKTRIMFIALIILQFYLLPLLTLLSGANYEKYVSYSYLYVIISYTIIILSIIIFGNELDMFQDYFSLGIILLSCFLRADLGGNNELLYRGILMLLGLVLLFYIATNRGSIKIPTLKSVFVGLLWSAGTAMGLASIRLLLDSRISILPSNLVSYIFSAFVYHFSFVTIIEESCFRGILFGLLVANNFKKNSALVIQGILFWGIHYMKIADPILFFILLPLFTLSATLLIKKYRMLYMPIMAHTFNNVFGALLVALFRHV